MSVRRVLPSGYFLFGFAPFVAAILGSTFEARAQADLNMQSRLDTFTTPLVLSPEFAAPAALSPGVAAALATMNLRSGEKTKGGACMSDPLLILKIQEHYRTHPYYTSRWPRELPDLIDASLGERLTKNPEEAAHILREALIWLKDNGDAEDFTWLKSLGIININDKGKVTIKGAIDFSISLCNPRQTTTVKLSLPFNPTQESNVLKSNQNVNSDTSIGFGGTLQVTTGGVRDYDVMGLSIGSTSARYDRFPSKSLDSLAVQGAYQFLIGAFGYYSDGSRLTVDKGTDVLPAQNLITIDTVSIGFQNQRAYTPTFQLETVDLFTPQVTLSRKNISLTGSNENNVCATALPDFRKSGFCYYADLSLTVGQTFSDLSRQQNTNVAASATLGRRFDQSDWKFAVQTVVTSRAYEDVVGGRHDVLLQVAPTLTYAPPAFVHHLGNTSVSFNLPVTYNQNYSTVAKAEWHGVVVMPTLTVAFQPPAQAK